MRLAGPNSCVAAKEHEWKWKPRAGPHHTLGPSHITNLLTSPAQEISNSRHIRVVSRQVKTSTRNSKMAALLTFIAYVQFANSARPMDERQQCIDVKNVYHNNNKFKLSYRTMCETAIQGHSRSFVVMPI